MIPISKPTRCVAGWLAPALALICLAGAAHAADVVWNGSVGDNNWNSGGNWDGGFFPEAQYEEVGVIDNGDTAFIAIATPDAAGLTLGQAAASSGGLEVRDGGSINFVESTGAPDGSVIVGLDGTGNLTVRRGGSLAGTSLSVNGDSSLIVGGGPGAGPASLIIGGGVNLDGATRIIAAGQTVSAPLWRSAAAAL